MAVSHSCVRSERRMVGGGGDVDKKMEIEVTHEAARTALNPFGV